MLLARRGDLAGAYKVHDFLRCMQQAPTTVAQVACSVDDQQVAMSVQPKPSFRLIFSLFFNVL